MASAARGIPSSADVAGCEIVFLHGLALERRVEAGSIRMPGVLSPTWSRWASGGASEGVLRRVHGTRPVQAREPDRSQIRNADSIY